MRNLWEKTRKARGERHMFENLRIDRVAVHEVFQRNEDRSMRQPAYAPALERLSAEALVAFRLRMTQALSGETQSLTMRIARHGVGTFLDAAQTLIGSSDADFLAGSMVVADRLAEAQMARRIPGGMVIVFDGTAGAPAVPFVGVIKAETQEGFRRSAEGAEAVIEFLQNIFLTPATRLYKIGLMLRTDASKAAPEGWRAVVFDSNISKSNREQAAQYFYEGFLGCVLPSDGPYETMRFFDLTKEFVKRSDIDGERKRDLIDSLHVFVRDEQDPTFSAEQYSDRYLPEVLQDPYSAYMEAKKFTAGAVVRDTSQMAGRLRRRRLKFGADIELSASPEALSDKITIEAIDGHAADGQIERWTRLTIRERLTGEQ